jgi:hypothetical protein
LLSWFADSAKADIKITTATLPDGTVGSAYSATINADGCPDCAWSSTGTLPTGLSLGSAGTISGTPRSPGSFHFTVTATDKKSETASQAYTINIASSAPITLSVSGVPDTIGSAVQMPLNLVLSSAIGQPVTGQVVLTFQPDAAVARDDPAIQFSTGSRTVSFSIPAGATKAVFPSSVIAFQTGTVAGTLNLVVSSSLGGSNASHSIVVPRAGPVIASASVVKSTSGFQVQVAGFSNTRELASASFHFTAASGQTVQTSDLNVSLANLASQWYSSSTSTPFGGQFLVIVPFLVSQGSVNGLSAVTVQLQNGQGTSAAATANF